jgi:hypothetical protein
MMYPACRISASAIDPQFPSTTSRVLFLDKFLNDLPPRRSRFSFAIPATSRMASLFSKDDSSKESHVGGIQCQYAFAVNFPASYYYSKIRFFLFWLKV